MEDLKKFEARLVRRAEFYDRIDRTRAELETLYSSDLPAEEKRRKKAAIFGDLRDRFRELRRKWGGRGLEGWLKRDINNADLVSLHTYQKHVPAFHKLLAECGGDLDEFYKRVKKLKLEGDEE